MQPTYEEQMLRKYTFLIKKHAVLFGRKTALPSHYWDDFYQEACIAFIIFLRAKSITAPQLDDRQLIEVGHFIDLHFLSAFQDTDGIGLNRNTRKRYYAEGGHGLDSVERLTSDATMSSSVYEEPARLEEQFVDIYFREWLVALPKEDRMVAGALAAGRTQVEVARRFKMSRQTVRTRVRRMRKSFTDYVEGNTALSAV